MTSIILSFDLNVYANLLKNLCLFVKSGLGGTIEKVTKGNKRRPTVNRYLGEN